MKQLWTIVKGFLTFVTFTGVVSLITLYISSTKNTSTTLNDEVVPQLNYLVAAEKANRERDSLMQLTLDTTKNVVDFLAADFVTRKADDPTLTTREFLEEIGELKNYIDDVKKKSTPINYQNPSPYSWRSDILQMEKVPTSWGIPPGWIPPLDKSLLIKGKSNSFQ